MSINNLKNYLRYLIGLDIKNPVFYISRLKDGDGAIDCGANIGEYTELMVRQGAEVYAFEPNPYAFEELSDRMKAYKKVHCLNKGVYTQAGKRPLYLHQLAEEDQVKWSVGSSLVVTKGNVDPNNFVEIELIDLADFINNLDQKIKLVKMDIEGAEVEVINKLIDSGAIKKIKWLIAEAHDKRMPELKIPMEKLRERIKKEKIKNINLGACLEQHKHLC